MHILFVTQYGARAASSRTRVFGYIPYLRSVGHRCEVVTVLPDEQIGGSQVIVTRQVMRKLCYYVWAFVRTLLCGLRVVLAAKRSNLIFVQKVIFPSFMRWMLRLVRVPIVYDFDDAIFTTEIRQPNWLAAQKQQRNARGVPAMLHLASMALVENDYTGDFARQHCPHVECITGPIDTLRYTPGFSSRSDDAIVLGWIGSASTLSYLEGIRPALEEVGRRFNDIRLHVVGASDFSLKHMMVEKKAWSLDSEVEYLRCFDIGIMPMPDDMWTRGKGGYKLLQYMAVGLPVITSPVGINREIVEDGIEGFWARDMDDWIKFITDLARDEGLRQKMGTLGRKKMEAHYALEAAQERLGELLGEVVGVRDV
ncbi:MAG: glycosyltransferase family 4 protein [Candidatus Latescibacterota bacterium]|nr:glycosyltransferase family 4 protein [Candidatus Latescibacterota bacterium]